MATTFDITSAVNGSIVLSNGDRTATNASSYGQIHTTDEAFRSSGKWQFEFVWPSGDVDGDVGMGFAEVGNLPTNYLGGNDNVSFAMYENGDIWHNSALVDSTLTGMVAGDHVVILLDLDANTAEFRVNGLTGVGNSVSGLSIDTGLLYAPAVSVRNGESATGNFVAADFISPLVSGFIDMGIEPDYIGNIVNVVTNQFVLEVDGLGAPTNFANGDYFIGTISGNPGNIFTDFIIKSTVYDTGAGTLGGVFYVLSEGTGIPFLHQDNPIFANGGRIQGFVNTGSSVIENVTFVPDPVVIVAEVESAISTEHVARNSLNVDVPDQTIQLDVVLGSVSIDQANGFRNSVGADVPPQTIQLDGILGSISIESGDNYRNSLDVNVPSHTIHIDSIVSSTSILNVNTYRNSSNVDVPPYTVHIDAMEAAVSVEVPASFYLIGTGNTQFLANPCVGMV